MKKRRNKTDIRGSGCAAGEDQFGLINRTITGLSIRLFYILLLYSHTIQQIL
jgi:hypothetical protein